MQLKAFRSICQIGSIAVVLFAFAACNRDTIEAQRPPSSEDTLSLTPPFSSVIVDLKYPVNELEAIIEQVLSGTFINNRIPLKKDGDSLDLKISRTAPIKMEWKKGELLISTSFQANAVYLKRLSRLKVNLSKQVDARADLVLVSKVSLTQDYKLKTSTTLQSISYQQKPLLDLGIVKINITEYINTELHKMAPKMLAKMDSTIAEKVKVKPAMERIWCQLGNPIRLNKKHILVWLKLNNYSLQAAPLASTKDTIRLRIKTSSTALIYPSNSKPDTICKPMPKLVYKNIMEEFSQLYFVAQLPYNDLNELINKQVKDMKFTKYGNSIKIKKIELYGGEKHLVLAIKVKGDINGTLYLQGDPYFNDSTRLLQFKNLKFDIASENVLVNAANWAYHSDVLKELENKLKLPFGQLVDRIPELVYDAIEKGKSGDKINTSIQELEVKVIDQKIGKEKLEILIKTQSKMGIELQKEVLEKPIKPLNIK